MSIVGPQFGKLTALQETFQEIGTSNIYKEFNTETNLFSKEALTLDFRVLLDSFFEDRTHI